MYAPTQPPSASIQPKTQTRLAAILQRQRELNAVKRGSVADEEETVDVYYFFYGIKKANSYPPNPDALYSDRGQAQKEMDDFDLDIKLDESNAPFGVVMYHKQLTMAEIEKYSLTPFQGEDEIGDQFVVSDAELLKTTNTIVEWAKKPWTSFDLDYFRHTNGAIIAFPRGVNWDSDSAPADVTTLIDQHILARENRYVYPTLMGKVAQLPYSFDYNSRRYWYISGNNGKLMIRVFEGSSPLSTADLMFIGLKAINAEQFTSGITDGAPVDPEIISTAQHLTQHLVNSIFDSPKAEGGRSMNPLAKFSEIANRTMPGFGTSRESYRNKIMPFVFSFIPGAREALENAIDDVRIGDGVGRTIGVEEANWGGHPVFIRCLLDRVLEKAPALHDGATRDAFLNALKSTKFMEMANADRKQQDLLMNPQYDKAPQVPNVDPEVELYPHQAYAVSAIANMDNAVLDVDVGGGKTIIAIVDIINLLNTGKINKAAFAMPQYLIPQQRKEILRLTNKQMNVVIITNETCGFRRAKFRAPGEELTEDIDFDTESHQMNPNSPRVQENSRLLDRAPKNTIFLISYEWLRQTQWKALNAADQRIYDESRDTRIYFGAEWLLSHGIDYVFFDESHTLKGNTTTTAGAKALAQGCKVRRLATGTIMPNSPEDLYNQVSIIAPGYFGSVEDFAREFGGQIHNGKIRQFSGGDKGAADAAKRIRQRLRENLGVSIRRDNWLHMLPERKEFLHYVKMPPKQYEVYKAVRDASLEHIMADESLRAAWEAIQQMDEGEDGDEDQEGGDKMFQKLLGRLGRINEAVNSPWLDEGLGDVLNILAERGLVKKPASTPKTGDAAKDEAAEKAAADAALREYLPPEERVSCKTKKVDEIIRAHLAKFPDSKVMVMGQTNRTVAAVMASSEFATKGVLYNAAKKELLVRFQKDPNIKVLFGVDKSLLAGRNMQFCNCLIRLDIPWNPGDLEQNYGRIYRFGQKSAVYLHAILAENTSDMARYARMVAKRQQSSKVNSDFDDPTQKLVFAMNVDHMTDIDRLQLENGIPFEGGDDDSLVPVVKTNANDEIVGGTYGDIWQQELSRNKAIRDAVGNQKFPIAVDGKLTGSKTPEMAGLPVQIIEGDKARASADKKEWQARAAGLDPDLKGYGVKQHYEFGGLPEEAVSDAARALMNDGVFDIHLQMLSYTGEDESPSIFLTVPIDEDDSASLRQLQFKRAPRRWMIKVKNSGHAEALLEKIVDRLVPGAKNWKVAAKKVFGSEAADLLAAIKKYLVTGKAPKLEVEAVKKSQREKAPEKIESMSLLFLDGDAYLSADDGDGNLDILKGLGFKRQKPQYQRVVKQRGMMQQIVDQIYKYGLAIGNFDELKSLYKAAVGITLKEPKHEKYTGAGDEEEFEEKRAKQHEKAVKQAEKKGLPAPTAPPKPEETARPSRADKYAGLLKKSGGDDGTTVKVKKPGAAKGTGKKPVAKPAAKKPAPKKAR